MSTFTPEELRPFKKTVPPNDDASYRVWVDQQLLAVQQSIATTHTAVEQLQAEMALIWTELTALGHPRP